MTFDVWSKPPLGSELACPDGSVYKRFRVTRSVKAGQYAFIYLKDMTVMPFEKQIEIPNAITVEEGKVKEEVWVMVQAPAYVPGKTISIIKR